MKSRSPRSRQGVTDSLFCLGRALGVARLTPSGRTEPCRYPSFTSGRNSPYSLLEMPDHRARVGAAIWGDGNEGGRRVAAPKKAVGASFGPDTSAGE
jgi:hypothetical protein